MIFYGRSKKLDSDGIDKYSIRAILYTEWRFHDLDH